MSKRTAHRPAADYDPNFSGHWGGDHAPDRRSYNYLLDIMRVHLNQGGYDSNGKYFGRGAPVYWVAGEGGVSFYIRAKDRAAAKALVRTGYPSAVIGR